MPWNYKSPHLFPAMFHHMLRTAVKNENTFIPFPLSQISLSEAKALAEKFRHFRWCVREQPEASREMAILIESYHFRTIVNEANNLYTLAVRASKSKLSEFIRLNPSLAMDIIRSVD